MDVANAALPAYVTVLLFFVGLLLRPQDQPKYWSWFAYINFLKYAWAAQMVNQYEHQPSYLPSTGRMEIHNPDITGHVLMGDGRSVSPSFYQHYFAAQPYHRKPNYADKYAGVAGASFLQLGRQEQMVNVGL